MHHRGHLTNRFVLCQVPGRCGFVLVLVLVLILVVGFSVAGFARKSLELARTVADAQETLQRRWGTRSCQRFLLANTERLLDGNASGEHLAMAAWPLASDLTAEISLGGCRMQLHLSDEEAKINLNALAQRGVHAQTLVSSVVQQLSSSSGLMTLVRWPSQEAAVQNRATFQTWEQVFDLQSEEDTVELTQRLQAATGDLTCWGSGKVNVRRASDDTVRIVCDGQVSERTIAKLLAQRRAGRFRDLDSLLRPLDLKNNEAAALKRLLAVQSRCHAVWLTVQSPRRSWTSFTVDRSGQGNPASFETFSW